MLTLLKLEMLRMVRNRRYIVFTVVLPLGFYLMYSAIYGANTAMNGTNWAAYLMISMASFGAMGAAFNVGGARLAVERKSGWTRQLRVTPLPPRAYFMAKILSALVMATPSVILVGLAAVLINHVSLPVTVWVQVLVFLVLGSLPFAALGVFLGYMLDTDTAQPATMMLYMALAFLGGLWAPIQSLPKALQQLAQALPSYHYADLGWRMLANQSLGLIDLAVLAGYLVLFGLMAIWSYRRDEAAQAA